ncbi:MAG: hypothetical protein EOO75_09500 [Myxococcales bacterium]|nr:MAG: hypothetical protein EOO75_09500 [Myxococcales bacterium]
MKLLCLAQVLGQCTGDQAVDLLIDILGSEVAEAQQAAGDALTEMAFARFKEVALGIERALGRLEPESAARSELPFVLLEVGGAEPGGVAKLLEKMLQQQDAEAVEAAIEACAELGDGSLVDALKALEKDTRRVELEDDAGETETVAIGQLASEACSILQGG